MPIVNRKYTGDNKSYIQAVRFLKSEFSQKQAHDYCIKHGYYVDGLDITDLEYHFRQFDPQDDIFVYRRLEGGRNWLYFIIGYRK